MQWKNTMAVPQNTFITSSLVKNLEAMRMSPKQNHSPPCGPSKTSQIQRKLFVEKALRSSWSLVSSAKLIHVAIVPLEQRCTLNSEWYTSFVGEIRKRNKKRRIIVIAHQLKSAPFWSAKTCVNCLTAPTWLPTTYFYFRTDLFQWLSQNTNFC